MLGVLQSQGFYHIFCQTNLLCLCCSMFVRLFQDLRRKIEEGDWRVFCQFISSSILSLSHLIDRIHLESFPCIVARLEWGQQSPREAQSWEDRSGSKDLREFTEGHGWLTSQSLAEVLLICTHSFGVSLTPSTLIGYVNIYIFFIYCCLFSSVLLCLFLSNSTLILIRFSHFYIELFHLIIQFTEIRLKTIQKPSAFCTLDTASPLTQHPYVSSLLLTPSPPTTAEAS